MTKSDPNKVLRQLPLVAGGLAGTLLMVNRLLTPQITDSQARSDVLGVIISALLILTGLLWQQVQARSPDSVQLIGSEGFEFAPDLPDAVKVELDKYCHKGDRHCISRKSFIKARHLRPQSRSQARANIAASA
jgi:hypothetical protein